MTQKFLNKFTIRFHFNVAKNLIEFVHYLHLRSIYENIYLRHN